MYVLAMVDKVLLIVGVTARMVDTHSGTTVEAFATNIMSKSKSTYTVMSPCVFCKGQHFDDECASTRS